jgi:hypothetical protein
MLGFVQLPTAGSPAKPTPGTVEADVRMDGTVARFRRVVRSLAPPRPEQIHSSAKTLTPSGETLVAQLKRDHKRLARALFAPMSRREFDGFARGLGGVVDRLRAHLVATGGRS